MSNYKLKINGKTLGQHDSSGGLISALFANADIAPKETALERHARKMQALDELAQARAAQTTVNAKALHTGGVMSTPEQVYPQKKY